VPATLERNEEAGTLELSLSGCRGFEFEDAKDKVKDIPGRRWNPDRKVWVVEDSAANADRILRTIRPSAPESLLAWIRESRMKAEESLTAPLPEDSTNLSIPWAFKRCSWQPEFVNDEPFNGLLNYQRVAVDIMATNGRAILADDMGLGKTLEGISAVEEWKLRNGQTDGPKLVVSPNSVKGSWLRELDRWLEDAGAQVVDARTPAKRHEQLQQAIKDSLWCVVNWEQLRIQKERVKLPNGGKRTIVSMKEPLFQYPDAADWDLSLSDWDMHALAKAERTFGKKPPGWLAALADEAHRAKNRESQQTQGLWRVQARVMYALTGTPLMNSPDELWALLRWLWPQEFHERGANYAPGAMAYWPFYMEYVDHYEDHFGRKVITGVRNPDGLRFILKDKLLRRTAAILGLKGRKRIYYDVPLTPKQRKLYEEAEKKMWLQVMKEAEEGDRSAREFIRAASTPNVTASALYRIPNGAARMVRLQQIIENCALLGGDDESALMDDFEQKYVDAGEQQWVVFCKYRESCTLLAKRLEKLGATVGVYTGEVKPEERTKLEDAFQRGALDVLIGTIGAMKEGITLTSGHLQYWLTRSFVPAENEQGESREDRLGQQELVRVYIPQAVNTVATDKVAPINRLKEGIVSTVIPKDKIEEVT
jgi:SNF2 family DNA or RNA helicase